MLDKVKELVDLGLPIIPLCSHDHKNMSAKHIERCKCAGKTPLIAGWQKHNETTEADLVDWQKSFKTFNIGLPLGDASGYCGIDIDGDEGVTLLQEMSGGIIPASWEFSTGAGFRLLYKIPVGVKTKLFKMTGEGIHQECRLMCSGQQTVIPPSTHYTGRVYEWAEEHSPWDMDCADAPGWLINLIKLEDVPNVYSNKPSSSSMILNLLEDEFSSSSEMQFNIPDAVVSKNKDIRLQDGRGKTGHKIVVTDEMMTQMIPEGARDTTMTAIIGHYCANRDIRRFGLANLESICLDHNRRYCDPPLDDDAIKAKVRYFFDIEGTKSAQFDSKKGITKEEKRIFIPTEMADAVLDHIQEQGHFLHFDQFSKIYYIADLSQGPWRACPNVDVINKWIREVLTSDECGDLAWGKSSNIEEVKKVLNEHFSNRMTTVDAFDLGAHSEELKRYIIVNNGMLDWQAGELIDWDPNYHITVSFDIDYDRNATCPRFEKYLTEWLPEEETRRVMQEYLGYCLIPSTNFRRALFLHGKGKNGKSMLIEFLIDFFGSNRCALSFEGLFSKFGPATLKDKLVNIYDDTNVAFTKDTGIAKNLIAGGSIQAEFKGQQLFQFQNVARFIYSAQEMPRTSDTSDAWQDRWFFIKFPNCFRPSNRAKIQIQTALAEEKQGIFNWMIEGLKRLMANDDFTISTVIEQNKKVYRNLNDNVASFLDTLCVSCPGTNLALNTMFDAYQAWAENEQVRPLGKKMFTQRVEEYPLTKNNGYCASVGKRTTYFEDVTFNTSAEEYEDISLSIGLSRSLK